MPPDRSPWPSRPGHEDFSDAGFVELNLEPVDELMYFGVDVDEAFGFVSGQGFARFMLRDLDDDRRAGALAALRATICTHLTGDGVLYRSGAWIVSART